MCLWIIVFHGLFEAVVLGLMVFWGQVFTADPVEQGCELIAQALVRGGGIHQHFALDGGFGLNIVLGALDGVDLEATATGRKAGGAATVSA